MSMWWRAVFAFGAALLIHCGGDDANGTGPANDASAGGDAADAGGEAGPPAEASVDAGAPVASFATDAIDFGLVDCGGAAPGTKSLAIANTGTADLTWSAQLDTTTTFLLLGATHGVLPPGKSATVTISAGSVPPATVAGAEQGATLTVTTNDPAHKTTPLKVKETAAGATLAMTPSMGAAFGTVSVGAPTASIPITLKNTGNKPVKLNFVAPQNPQFGVKWTGAPADVTIAPGASVPGLVATFAPTSPVSAITNAPLVATGALCATTLQALPMSGQGTMGAFAATPAAIDFGSVSCGSTSALPAAQRTVTITNAGNQTYTWKATLGRGAASPFSLVTTNTTIAPNGAPGTIVVAPKAIPKVSAVTDDLYGDTITITTDILADAPHTITLRETASGAILGFQPATPIAFGGTPINTTTTAQVAIVNTGNAAANVTLAATGGPVFSLSLPAVGLLNPGASQDETVTFAPTVATAGQTSTVSVSASANDAICAPLPTLAIGGDGTNGVATVSPGSLDFGPVDCGTRAGAKTVTVSNAGTASFAITGAALTAGTSYAVSPSTFPIAVAPGANVVFTVTPNGIPATSDVTPDLYGDTLTITTNAAMDTPHVVPLHMTAHGAILATSTNAVAFGGVPTSTTATSDFTVSNQGNASAAVSFTGVSAPFAVSPQGATVAGGGSETLRTSFAPTQTQGYTQSAQLAVANGTPLCAPLPAAVALSGTGTTGVAVVTPSSLDFGLVPCNTTASSQSITIQNNGTATFTWSASLSSGASTYYQLAPASGSVDPGAQASLVVTPSAVPATSLTTPDLYAGTVTITTTGAMGDTPHVVALHETAFGARIAIDVTQLAFPATNVGQSSQLPFVLHNGGNATAALAFMGFDSPPLVATPNNPSIAGGADVNMTMTFSPQAAGALSRQTFGVATTDLLCAPLPSAIPVTGTGQ